MSKKIGQTLIDHGVLTPAQLETALQSQLIHGGQLGTSLIELGFIDEATLGRALAAAHGLPHAPAEMFEDIPADILDGVSPEVVQRRRVIPIGVERRSLHLAVVDPRNLSSLSSSTGYRIVPYLAPEIRILLAMERYYGIPRPARYVRLSYSLKVERGRGQDAAAAGRPPRSRKASRRARVEGAEDNCPPELQALSHRLSEVRDHADLGEAILDYTLEGSDRALLFDVSGEQAVVANWKGIELDGERMCRVKLPVTADSLFALVNEDACYRGPVPQDFPHESFYGTLGMQAPQEILILPIYRDDRLEAVVYADGGIDGALAGTGEDYPLLLERIGIALKVIDLRRQLRS